MEKGKRLYKKQLDPAFAKTDAGCYNTRRTWEKKVTASMLQLDFNNTEEGVKLFKETYDVNAEQGTNTMCEASMGEDLILQTSREDKTIQDTNFEAVECEMQCEYQESLAERNEVGQHSSADYRGFLAVDSNLFGHKLGDDNRIMFEKSGLTVGQVVSAAVAFGLRFHQTQTERLFFFDFLKMLAGPEFAKLNISNYKISMAFDPPDDKITYHFYCTICHVLLHSSTKRMFKKCSVLCLKCNEMFDLSFAFSNLFLRLNLKH